jgi:hypothetical protein
MIEFFVLGNVEQESYAGTVKERELRRRLEEKRQAHRDRTLPPGQGHVLLIETCPICERPTTAGTRTSVFPDVDGQSG